ncbi:MAG: hypothetical protein JXA20_13005 [Spirochaetes bacterium]|nr:hypothetical protein [Spirochaetota bacterium]
MRAILVLFASVIVAAVIGFTACESLYDEYIPQNGGNYIYLFRSNSTTTGNLGGRAGADAICRGTYETWYSHLEALHVRAFLNVSAYDTIREMPENHGIPADAPVVAMNYTTGAPGPFLATSWYDLLDGSISMSLYSAGLFTGGSNYWTGDISGYGTTGLDGDLNCNGWTSSSTVLHGRGGDNMQSGVGWLSVANLLCDGSTSVPLLCVAW